MFLANIKFHYFRSRTISTFAKVLGEELNTIFNLPKKYIELANIIKENVKVEFSNLGLNLYDFHINSISVPPEVQKSIDSRSGMKAVGDLNEFLKFKTANSLDKNNSNSNSNQGLEAGIGLGLGMSMVKSFSDDKIAKENPYERIKKLKELVDLEAITKEEYEELKSKILNNF